MLGRREYSRQRKFAFRFANARHPTTLKIVIVSHYDTRENTLTLQNGQPLFHFPPPPLVILYFNWASINSVLQNVPAYCKMKY